MFLTILLAMWFLAYGITAFPYRDMVLTLGAIAIAITLIIVGVSPILSARFKK